MLLKRWEPINELRRADAEMGRLRRHLYRPFYTWPRSWSVDGGVDIDIYQESDNLVVQATVPGVSPEDIEVAIADGNLTLKGERKHDKEVKEEALPAPRAPQRLLPTSGQTARGSQRCQGRRFLPERST